MNFDDVKIAARNHLHDITVVNPILDLPRALLSEEAQSTSLASLVEKLDISASATSIYQVGSYS